MKIGFEFELNISWDKVFFTAGVVLCIMVLSCLTNAGLELVDTISDGLDAVPGEEFAWYHWLGALGFITQLVFSFMQLIAMVLAVVYLFVAFPD